MFVSNEKKSGRLKPRRKKICDMILNLLVDGNVDVDDDNDKEVNLKKKDRKGEDKRSRL